MTGIAIERDLLLTMIFCISASSSSWSSVSLSRSAILREISARFAAGKSGSDRARNAEDECVWH